MKIGFLSDIHGNLQALQAALDSLGDVDRLICLGDLVEGPDDTACIRLLRERRVETTLGNHDYWVGFDLPPLRLPSEQREWLKELPVEYAGEDWVAAHSLYEDQEGDFRWLYVDSEEMARRALVRWSQRICFVGHTHVPRVFELVSEKMHRMDRDCLLAAPTVGLKPGSRYVFNVGGAEECVVVYSPESQLVTYRWL